MDDARLCNATHTRLNGQQVRCEEPAGRWHHSTWHIGYVAIFGRYTWPVSDTDSAPTG